jgi:hypothetical protein
MDGERYDELDGMAEDDSGGAETAGEENQGEESQGTIREIGHLFLSSIREKAGEDDGVRRRAPVRIPPAPLRLPAILGGEGGNAKCEMRSAKLEEGCRGGQENVVSGEAVGPSLVDLVVAVECEASRRLVEAWVRYVSAGVGEGAGVGAVGLVWLEKSRCRLVVAGDVEVDVGGKDFASAVAGLRGVVKRWVVAAVPGRLAELDLEGILQVRVLAGTDDESVVAAYKCAKAVAADGRLGAGCEVVAEVMASKRLAEGVIGKLQQVSKEHLAGAVKGGAIVAGRGFYDVGAKMAEVAIAVAAPVGMMGMIRAGAELGIGRAVEAGPQVQVASDKLQVTSDVSAGSDRVAGRVGGVEPAEERVIELSGSAAEALAADGQWGLKLLKARVPHFPEARLAVDGAGRVALLAEVSGGAEGLERLGQAYGWVCDSRELIAMVAGGGATAASQPHLYLLVKGSSRVGAMLARSNVTVVGYRVVRWGEKRGMLLAA